MEKENTIRERLVVKNALFTSADVVCIACALLCIYAAVFEATTGRAIVLLAGISVFILILLIRRWADRRAKIVIDKFGITLRNEYHTVIPWADIKYAYLKQKTVGVGKSARVAEYFHIETKDGELVVRMDNYGYSARAVNRHINRYSGRSIGNISDKLTENARLLTKNKESADRTYAVFKSFYKRQLNTGMMMFIALLAAAVVLQVMSNFPYMFACGLTVTVVIAVAWSIFDGRKLRRHEFFADFDDKTYEALINEYGKEFDYKTSLGTNIFYGVVLALLIVLTFVISYFVATRH